MGGKTVFIAWIALVSIFFAIILVTKIAIKTSWYIWIPIYIAHIALVVTVATQFSQVEGLGFASVIIIMAESIRMMMKAHSYLRTKLIYLTENPYKNFEFRGVKVLNASHHRNHEYNHIDNNNLLKFNIKDEDIFS